MSEELKRNAVKGEYIAAKAHTKSVVRRKKSKYQGMRIVECSPLREFVEQALLGILPIGKNGEMPPQSPGAIAGRLKAGLALEPETGLPLPYVSRSAIGNYISSVHGRQLEYQLSVLKKEQGRKRKRRKPSSRDAQSTGDEKVYIDDRPLVIQNRKRVGDLEVDFIVSGKGGSGYCLTAADRKLRVGFIRLILPVTVANALEALLDIKRLFPEMKSITTDNDILWRHHKQLEEVLGAPFYFCHSYSSWEKGGIENFNRQARRYIRKGSDISQYSPDYIKQTEIKLNNRFMKCLGHYTPQEALDMYRTEQTGKKTPKN